MKRIYLTKEEKKILRYLNSGHKYKLSKYEEYVATKSLEEKKFVRGAYVEGHEVEAINLLPYGKAYISKYPNLLNALNIELLLSIISIIIACIGLFFPRI